MLAHSRRLCGAAARHQNEHTCSWEGCTLPTLSQKEGCGETRLPQLVPGRAAPFQLVPRGRGVGKPGFPISQPLLGAAGAPTGRGAVRQAHRRWGNPVSPYVHLSHPCGCAAQRQNENMCSWEGTALPNPPRWRVVSWEGVEARRRRASTPKPSPGRGVGKPGFPTLRPASGRLISGWTRWSPTLHWPRLPATSAQRQTQAMV